MSISNDGKLTKKDSFCGGLSFDIDENIWSIAPKVRVTWKAGPPSLSDDGFLSVPLGVFAQPSCRNDASIHSSKIMQHWYDLGSRLDQQAPWPKKFRNKENHNHLDAGRPRYPHDNHDNIVDATAFKIYTVAVIGVIAATIGVTHYLAKLTIKQKKS